MRIIYLALFLVFAGCVAPDKADEQIVAPRNLTEAEIRSLPSGTTFKQVRARLRYYSGCEVAVPLITFAIEGGEGKDCAMLFEDKTDRLLFAWLSAPGANSSDVCFVLWPKAKAGKTLAELEAEYNKKVKGEPAATAQCL